MIPADFRELLQREPFQPFRLHLSNGTTYEIRHPELAVLRFSVVWLHFPAKDLPVPVSESQVIADLGQILFIDFLPPQGGPSPNGS